MEGRKFSRIQIEEVSGELMALAFDGPKLKALCLRCGAVVSVWRNLFRARPGPCTACKVAEGKAHHAEWVRQQAARALQEKVGGCEVLRAEGAYLWLACPCGAEFRITKGTARTGQTHTPRRCPACRARER